MQPQNPGKKILRPQPMVTARFTVVVHPKVRTAVRRGPASHAAFLAMAEKLGYQLTPMPRMKQELALAISKRLVHRSGNKLYQVASFTLENFALSVLRSLIPVKFEDQGATQSAVSWTIPTVRAMRDILGSFMADLPNFSAGISRGQQAPSENVIRVLATMMPPLALNWWMPHLGTGRVQVNFAYVLVQGTGDLHPPKDNQKREMALSPQLETSLRQAALDDAMAMGNLGYSLSPEWWRQLGQESRAQQTTAMLQAINNMNNNQPLQSTTGRKRKVKALTQAVYPIACIRGERQRERGMEYLVRWEGYHPSWEEWRPMDFAGQVGDPVETWEPAALVKNTLALQEWEELMSRH